MTKISTADAQPIYFKLLLGASPEGAWTLPLASNNTEALFWADEQ